MNFWALPSMKRHNFKDCKLNFLFTEIIKMKNYLLVMRIVLLITQRQSWKSRLLLLTLLLGWFLRLVIIMPMMMMIWMVVVVTISIAHIVVRPIVFHIITTMTSIISLDGKNIFFLNVYTVCIRIYRSNLVGGGIEISKRR